MTEAESKELALKEEDEYALKWLDGRRVYCINRLCDTHNREYQSLTVSWDVADGLVRCEKCGQIYNPAQEAVTRFLFRQYSKKSSIQLTVRVTQEMKDAIKKIAEESISEAMEQAKAAR